MFCTNCGKALGDGAQYCSACGAAVQGAVPVEAESPGGAGCGNDRAGLSALPEGIVMDETGVLHWEYVQNMWKNPVHLYLLLKIFFVVATCVLVIISVMGALVGSFQLKDIVFACALIYGTCLVLCLLGVAFVNLFHGGRNYYEFVMGAEGVMHIANRKNFAKVERLMDAGAVIGTLTGDANMVGASMAGRNNTYAMKFAEVKEIHEHRQNDYIELYESLFSYNHIYAYPHQYDFVLNYIKARCLNVK